MKSCVHFESQFVDALYGDLPAGDKSRFNEHIASCDACRNNYGKLQDTLLMMDKRDRREPPTEVMDRLWESIEPHLGEVQKAGNNIFKLPLQPAIRRWLPKTAAVAAILLFGILIGRFWQTQDIQAQQLTFNSAWIGQPIEDEEQLTLRTRAYLERSRIILLGLINLDEDSHSGAIDISPQAVASRQLVEEASLLKPALSGQQDRKIYRLVADLEVLLMQIANLEQEEQADGLLLLREGVERHSIMLKLDLEAARKKKNDKKSMQI